MTAAESVPEGTGREDIKRLPIVPPSLRRREPARHGHSVRRAGLAPHALSRLCVLRCTWWPTSGTPSAAAPCSPPGWSSGGTGLRDTSLCPRLSPAGRPGHQHAMSAHTEGRRVRKSRGQIIAVCGGLALIAGLLMARFSPWWGWALLGSCPGRRAGAARTQARQVADPAGRSRAEVRAADAGRSSPGRSARWASPASTRSCATAAASRSSPTCTATAKAGRRDLDLPHGVTAEDDPGQRASNSPPGCAARCRRRGRSRCRTSTRAGCGCGSGSTTSPR